MRSCTLNRVRQCLADTDPKWLSPSLRGVFDREWFGLSFSVYVIIEWHVDVRSIELSVYAESYL